MVTNKHDNYHILNLIGYGLAKYNMDFVREFQFNSKQSFYSFLIELGVADTTGTIKNRQDLFDPYFDNGRKGWWQKAETYIHRKELIDSLFGFEDYKSYAQIVKLYLNQKFNFQLKELEKPTVNSKFRKMQETGLEAESFFLRNYKTVDKFKEGKIEDGRTYGDGYDFQIEVKNEFYLIEVKGVRSSTGSFRFTDNEYNKAIEFGSNYYLALIYNLETTPNLICLKNPTTNFNLIERSSSLVQISHNSEIIDWSKF